MRAMAVTVMSQVAVQPTGNAPEMRTVVREPKSCTRRGPVGRAGVDPGVARGRSASSCGIVK